MFGINFLFRSIIITFAVLSISEVNAFNHFKGDVHKRRHVLRGRKKGEGDQNHMTAFVLITVSMTQGVEWV